MTRRTRRPSFFRIALLVAVIGLLLYINQVVVPATPPLFIPTPTPTLSPEAYLTEADELYSSGKINAAINAYKSAIDVDPSNVATFVTLARLQVFAGQYDAAIENTQNALLKNPNNSLAHAVQGWALGFQGKFGEAELAIRKALELDGNNALAHAYYAEILINQNDFELVDKAGEESRLARDMDSSLLEVHRARGIVLLNTNNVDEAIEEFKAALAINKNIADIHLYLGVAYKAQGDYSLAEESLLAAYALNPQDTVALTEIARAYFADGRYRQAAQYAEEAVRVAPADPTLHGNLGIMHYKNEEYSRAIPEFELAVRGGTTEDGTAVEGLPLAYGRVAEYYWYYGFALARSNQCAQAVPIFQSLLTNLQNDEIAVFNATAG
ncbi:MAG TPA: tetratricopeptide repeat protein, partial [Anaerolineales bacterium]|nr:tetratricopeptide repeat protein [Anaerolineales bacterium]